MIMCRKKGSKENFLKIVKNKNGEFFIEREVRLDGRGAYICYSVECFAKAKKSKALERSLKIAIPVQIYDDLEKELGALEGR